MSASERSRVAVCICTYRRPRVLEDLLVTIAHQAEDAAANASVSVVVVDDDPAGSARSVAESASGLFERGLSYSCTGSGNVAVARNRALERGSETSDLLLLIDDDCRPDPGWLGEMTAMQLRTGADAVAGACDTEFPDGTARWLREEPFTDEASVGEDGAEVTDAYLKNLLVTTAFLQEHDLRFALRFGEAGGEDAMFIHQARSRGMRMVYAANALVRERLPAERTGLRYQLRRRWWYGNTEAVTSIASGQASRLKMVLSGAKLALLGLIRPARRAARGHSPQVRFAVSEVLRGGGRVLGALGIKLDHR